MNKPVVSPADQPANPGRVSAPLHGPHLDNDQRLLTGRNLAESAAVFLVGLTLATAVYSGAKAPQGVPGNDSFYHLRMAEMLPEAGLIDTFPWLRYAYFADQGDRFVSHHYGFHLMLLPFAKLSNALTGDSLAGGRWAVTLCSAINLMLVNLVLIQRRVPWRWLWLIIYTMLPYHYFTRHAHVRAISPSLMFLLLLVACLFGDRRRWAALVIALYVHLYLGAVMYAPLVVIAWALPYLDASPDERRRALRMVLWTAGGWTVGAVTYPYAGGMIDFLRLQVFGTGLSPDIEVGNEWRPYADPWWFAMGLCGPILGTLCVALFVRLRHGRRVDRETTTLLLLNFAFLVLTLKARRFIEYWPVFCLLSSATLAGPWLERVQSRGWEAIIETARDRASQLWLLLVGPAVAAVIIGSFVIPRFAESRELLRSWTWVLAAGGLYTVVLLSWLPAALRRERVTWHVIPALACTAVAVGSLAVLSAAVVAGPSWRAAQNEAKCAYDVEAIREMMTFLKENSQAGDLIFTDDWDVFPVFFYYNTHNHYIVGLDPKFTHERRPDLWERFVRITRGEIPTESTVRMPGPGDSHREERISIRLEDIRDVFGAQFVITDRDHRKLGNLLAANPTLTEFVYPPGEYAAASAAPYLVFRIRPPVGPPPAPPAGNATALPPY